VRSLVMPLLGIAHLDFTPPAPAAISGLIFTSRHAVSAFVATQDMGDWAGKPVFVVGHATAARARHAGFKAVFTGCGGGAGLVPVVAGQMVPGSGTLLWPAGADKSFDMAEALQPLGLAVSVIDVYVARPVIDPDPETIQQLASEAVLGVIVMSARSALLFNDFLDSHDLGHLRSHICVIAASQSIAVAAGDGWRQIYTAKQPRRSRLLAIATLLYHRRSSIPVATEQ